jgi:hypothetical protein
VVGRLWTHAGWVALAFSAAVSSSTASASVPVALTDVDDGSVIAAPGTVHVRFDLVPSHDGIRTVVVDEDSGRRTPVGDVPAGAVCEATVSPEGSFRYLELTCGSNLEVHVSQHPKALHVWGDYGLEGSGPRFSDELPLPPETSIELDGSLYDPAPPPSCEGTEEAPVELSLQHVEDRVAFVDQVRLRSTFGPIEAGIWAPVDPEKGICISRGDVAGHHYQYVCSGVSYETSVEVHVRNRTVYAFESDRMPCSGRMDIKGVWSVPCGAHLRYPAGTEVVRYEDGHFEDSPEDVRANEKFDAELEKKWGLASE